MNKYIQMFYLILINNALILNEKKTWGRVAKNKVSTEKEKLIERKQKMNR